MRNARHVPDRTAILHAVNRISIRGVEMACNTPRSRVGTHALPAPARCRQPGATWRAIRYRIKSQHCGLHTKMRSACLARLLRGGARGQRSQLGVNSCHFGRVKLRRRPDRALVPGLDPGITGPSTHHRWREGGWGHAPPSPRRSGARPNRQPPPPQRISTPGSTPACIAGRATGGWRPSNTRRRPLDQSSSPGPAPQRVNPDPWLRRRGLRCGRPHMGSLRTIATWHRGDARRWRRRPRRGQLAPQNEPRGEYLGRVGSQVRASVVLPEHQGLPRTQPSQRRRDPRRPVQEALRPTGSTAPGQRRPAQRPPPGRA